jgi:hypothetical protein
MKTEANLSDNHRANYVMVLSSLSSSDVVIRKHFLNHHCSWRRSRIPVAIDGAKRNQI